MKPPKTDLLKQPFKSETPNWFGRLELGDRVICVDSSGWPSLEEGVPYEVVRIWPHDMGVDLRTKHKDVPVYHRYEASFRPVTES